MNKEEEREYYEAVLYKVMINPRYYLDNLERFDSFRVSFINYSTKRRIKPKPYIKKA
jgi:hypothetical protein